MFFRIIFPSLFSLFSLLHFSLFWTISTRVKQLSPCKTDYPLLSLLLFRFSFLPLVLNVCWMKTLFFLSLASVFLVCFKLSLFSLFLPPCVRWIHMDFHIIEISISKFPCKRYPRVVWAKARPEPRQLIWVLCQYEELVSDDIPLSWTIGVMTTFQDSRSSLFTPFVFRPSSPPPPSRWRVSCPWEENVLVVVVESESTFPVPAAFGSRFTLSWQLGSFSIRGARWIGTRRMESWGIRSSPSRSSHSTAFCTSEL